jgi:hypothetical protein
LGHGFNGLLGSSGSAELFEADEGSGELAGGGGFVAVEGLLDEDDGLGEEAFAWGGEGSAGFGSVDAGGGDLFGKAGVSGHASRSFRTSYRMGARIFGGIEMGSGGLIGVREFFGGVPARWGSAGRRGATRGEVGLLRVARREKQEN